ncbi:MAG: Holliday junction resolvase RuvX [Planctomycetota bacterium]|jgi:putative Holliday junction resolvase
MRVLGIDYGERWIGLAITDELGMIASPLESLRVKAMEEAVAGVVAAAKEHNAQKLVVGHARDLSGKRGTKAKECEAFAEALTTEGLSVVLWDERLSTVQAERHLLASELSHRKRKKKLDSVAAQIILQSWLSANS